MAHDREVEGGGVSSGDANIYHCLEVDWFYCLLNGGNSRVAHNREAERGGMSPVDTNIHATLGVDDVH